MYECNGSHAKLMRLPMKSVTYFACGPLYSYLDGCLKNEIYHKYPRFIAGSITIEPQHDKTNKMISALSKDSDQPGHLPSLISLHCSHEEALGP